MAVLRFDPFRGFENLSNKVGSMINEAEMGVRFEYGNFKPRVDILEDSEKIYVFAELAGVKKIDVKVTINEENMLIIKGDKRVVIDADSLNKESHIRRERTFEVSLDHLCCLKILRKTVFQQNSKMAS